MADSGGEDESTEEATIALMKEVVTELREAWKELRERDTPFRRRAIVRAVFASIEGFVVAMKQIALLHPEKFEANELALLREEAPFLDRGKIFHKPNKLSIRDTLPFAFQSYMKIQQATTTLEFDDDWNTFLCGIRLRDRVTHPKSAEDFVVSNADLACLEQITEWLTEKTLRGMMEKIPERAIIVIGLVVVFFAIFSKKATAPHDPVPDGC